MAVGQKQWDRAQFGVGEFTTYFRAYFSGDWDVKTGGTIWILTHGQMGTGRSFFRSVYPQTKHPRGRPHRQDGALAAGAHRVSSVRRSSVEWEHPKKLILFVSWCSAENEGMNLGIPLKETIGDGLYGSFPHSLLSTSKLF